MRYLLASDLDGTLYVHGLNVQKNIDAINRFRKEGHLFGIVTGRDYVNGYLASVCAKTAADEIISNTTVTYTVSNGLLTAATYSSNDTVSYGYDEVGRLIRLVNVDGCGYVFTYSDDTEIISTITAKAAMGTEQEASGTQTVFSRRTEQTVTVTEEWTQ